MKNEENMNDGCGLPINSGFYSDNQVFHYYHVIGNDPRNFLVKRDDEEDYSPLKRVLANSLIRVIRQDQLIKLMHSAEQENLLTQTSPKYTGQPPGEFGIEWEYDEKGHQVPIKSKRTKETGPRKVIETAGPSR